MDYKSIASFLIVFASSASLFAQMPASAVTVDRDKALGRSMLSLGVAYTHLAPDTASVNPDAAKRAEALIKEAACFQNIHLMGWGAGNPELAPGEYDFKSLDYRIGRMRKLGIPIVMTLCTAPGWMKRGGKDWEMEKRVLPEHYDAFAELCVEAAKRYPDIRYFQVWNELKGFWSTELNNWDCIEYTRLYNKVFLALKKHDPGLKVGGLYLVMKGSGNQNPDAAKASPDARPPIIPKDREVIKYWLDNKAGADFICFDRSVKSYHDKNQYSSEELMTLTPWFGKATEQIREMTDLPVWWSEYYGLGYTDSLEQQAAVFASIYISLVKSGASVALLWNPLEGEVKHWLISDIRKDSGGQPTPHYQVFKMFHDHFGAGTSLVSAVSSSPEIEALASDRKILLLNKSPRPTAVFVNGVRIDLAPYQFLLRDFPSGSKQVSE